MPWDDNNVARLRELWDQGLPTAQIGKLLDLLKMLLLEKLIELDLKEDRPQLENSC